jgi:hypothetical protein
MAGPWTLKECIDELIRTDPVVAEADRRFDENMAALGEKWALHRFRPSKSDTCPGCPACQPGKLS